MINSVVGKRKVLSDEELNNTTNKRRQTIITELSAKIHDHRISNEEIFSTIYPDHTHLSRQGWGLNSAQGTLISRNQYYMLVTVYACNHNGQNPVSMSDLHTFLQERGLLPFDLNSNAQYKEYYNEIVNQTFNEYQTMMDVQQHYDIAAIRASWANSLFFQSYQNSSFNLYQESINNSSLNISCQSHIQSVKEETDLISNKLFSSEEKFNDDVRKDFIAQISARNGSNKSIICDFIKFVFVEHPENFTDEMRNKIIKQVLEKFGSNTKIVYGLIKLIFVKHPDSFDDNVRNNFMGTFCNNIFDYQTPDIDYISSLLCEFMNYPAKFDDSVQKKF